MRATEAVSAYVLFASSRLNGLVPVAQFDQFEHLEKPAMQLGRKGKASASRQAPPRARHLCRWHQG